MLEDLEKLRPPEMRGKPAKTRLDYPHAQQFEAGFKFCKEKTVKKLKEAITEALNDSGIGKDEIGGLVKALMIVEDVK